MIQGIRGGSHSRLARLPNADLTGELMSTVFISYSHVDTSTADKLASLLSSLDIEFFRDVKDINWGNSISSKVRDGLETCAAILVVVSPASLKSHWVPYEIGYASALRRLVLPYLTHPSLDVPKYIDDLSYVTTVKQAKDYFTDKFADEAKDAFGMTEHASPLQSQIILDDMQIQYLLEISKPLNDGSVHGGVDEIGGRETAPYREAIKLFAEHDLMEYGDGAYLLSAKGWKLADQLWALKILDALDIGEFVEDTDLAKAVGLTDSTLDAHELKRHVSALKDHGWIRMNSTMHGWCVQITEQGVTQRKHREIDV